MDQVEPTKKEVLKMRNSQFSFLAFSVETETDFPEEENYLPTLDTKVKLLKDNTIRYWYWLRKGSWRMTWSTFLNLWTTEKWHILISMYFVKQIHHPWNQEDPPDLPLWKRLEDLISLCGYHLFLNGAQGVLNEKSTCGFYPFSLIILIFKKNCQFLHPVPRYKRGKRIYRILPFLLHCKSVLVANQSLKVILRYIAF